MNQPMHCATVITFAMACFAAAAAAAEPSSVLQFRANRSMDRYTLVDQHRTWQKIDSDTEFAEQLRPAQGQIAIPSDQRIVLALMGQREKGKRPLLDPMDQLNDSQLLYITFLVCNLVAEDMERLDRHKQLKKFATILSRIDDEGIAAVCKSIEHLESLSIPESQITDNAVASISQLNRLRQLNLYGTRVTEAGLVYLKNLKQLQDLDLALTRVKGTGLQHLTALTKLRKLSLRKTNTRDDDLAHLQSLTNLERLDLKSTNMSDVGVRHLTSLKQLKYLDLSYNRITDASLKTLQQLKQLESLTLQGTGVSEAGVSQLNIASPDLNVTLGDETNRKALGAETVRQNNIKYRRELDEYFKSWD